MYSIFKDLTSGDYYVISSFSVEYPDYISMVDQGYMEKVKDGTKKECQQYLDENISELI